MPVVESAPEGQKTSSSGCCMGCVVVLFILAAGVVGALLYVRAKIQPLAAKASTAMLEEYLKQSKLSESDQTKIRLSVGRLTYKLERREMTGEQFKTMFQSLLEGPLLYLLMFNAVDEKYIVPSGLTEQEKEAGRRARERLLRGIAEGKISPQDAQQVMAAVPTEPGPNGGQQWKEHATDDEVRDIIAAAKQAADKAGVPDESYKIDIPAEVDKIVDAALAQTGSAAGAKP